ncbi:uncharacterized protein LOC106661844 [Cimex lectularius]|uniref:Uncharacterized protein n=1 Tax=Cimex lectularius TaxID=79782 RepID=A0A8I6RBV4_CIMLE|nr:uncharacterized protein LOC106661844 [Cimex lectularius]XP_014241044.1 uncharacterized protein LOC106661844 [Cimex lectularius]
MAKVPDPKTPVKSADKNKSWNPQPRPGNPIYLKKVDSAAMNTSKVSQAAYQEKNEVNEAKKMATAEMPKCSPNDEWSAECDDMDRLNAWNKNVSPDDNLIKGMAQALALIIQVASNGPNKIDREKAFYGIQFLSTIKNNYGEAPPNVKGFMEYIEHYMCVNDQLEKTTRPL